MRYITRDTSFFKWYCSIEILCSRTYVMQTKNHSGGSENHDTPRENHSMTPLPKQTKTSRFPSLEQNPFACFKTSACMVHFPSRKTLHRWVVFQGFMISPIVPYLPIVPHRYMSWLQKWGQDFATPTTNLSSKENIYQFQVGKNYHDYHDHRCFLCDVPSYIMNGQ